MGVVVTGEHRHPEPGARRACTHEGYKRSPRRPDDEEEDDDDGNAKMPAVMDGGYSKRLFQNRGTGILPVIEHGQDGRATNNRRRGPAGPVPSRALGASPLANALRSLGFADEGGVPARAPTSSPGSAGRASSTLRWPGQERGKTFWNSAPLLLHMCLGCGISMSSRRGLCFRRVCSLTAE